VTVVPLKNANWRGLISLDAAYTYLPTFTRVLKEYNREKHNPCVHGRGELRE